MKISTIIGAIIVLLLIAIPTVLGLFADLWWFQSLGYDTVFLKILFTSIGIGVASFVFASIIIISSVWLSKRAAIRKTKKKIDSTKMHMMIIFSLLVSLALSFGMSGSWATVLSFFNQSGFGVFDPVFGMDIGFFVFSLPMYSLILDFVLSVFIFGAIIGAISFIIHSSGIKFEENSKDTEKSSKPDFFFLSGDNSAGGSSVKVKWNGSWDRFVPILSIMLFLIFIIGSLRIWISQYGVVFSAGGAVFGAGFTDLNVTLPLITILSIVSFVISVMFLANIKLRKVRFVRDGIAAFIIIAIIGLALSTAIQALVVEPDEFNTEKPYIERNIQSTLNAYNLENIVENDFAVDYNLSKKDLQNNRATLDNIRLWDWRPLKQTYQQLQLFRTYYDFNDVDIDRYIVGGKQKQVMVSAREINTKELSSEAQSWVNTHLVYTHGFGVVMNPVDKATEEGLPEFYIQDIPPSSQFFNITQPRIYFGEKTDDYVITETNTEELDYPSGDKNINTQYSGEGGVALTSFARRLAYAAKFRSIELLVSGALTENSRILMHRNIKERINKVAPFLCLDIDPYIVVSEGKLYWMVDAYTITNNYPYSEPVSYKDLCKEKFNYIRNSVKVVIDAYTGKASFYIIDDKDPIVKTFDNIFPGMFKPISEISDDLKTHLRYPEGLLKVQSHIYSTYHMEDPAVFYNKEDVWVVPNEVYRGSTQQILPYFVILKLPDSDKEEFVLMIPFTPKGKENLVGWIAARSDAPNYGKAIVYQFSKQELTYGPMQVEARIDQDPDISQLITLWSQSGSNVVRGNTLVIPIENSLLYIEPLYLEATTGGTLPQLQRVIVSYGNKIAMEDTLEEALDSIFGSGSSSRPTIPDNSGKPSVPATAEEKVRQISELFIKAQEALANGNLGLYQEYVDQIGSISEGS